MSRIVFLLEERSMKVLLDGLLPRVFPNLAFLCISHEGKTDLEKSVPRKLRAWREPEARFVVLRDNDGGDCLRLKQRLVDLCRDAGRPDTLVRIACQELEAWYLGDTQAMADAFGNENLRGIEARARYRDPDAVKRPSNEIESLVPEFQKILGARQMAKRLHVERNRSASFKALIAGISRLAAAAPRPYGG